MAIHAYVGKPGSGKSYNTVQHVVVPSLKQGRHVVTNIPLNADALLGEFGGNITQLPLDWHQAADISQLFPPGCVALIDECWRRWPAGEPINKANPIDKAFLAEHRHRVDEKNNSMRVVLVTQDLAQISSWVRTLVDTTFRSRKFGKQIFKVEIYSGSVTGDSPPRKKLVRTMGGKFDPAIFSYYKSATQSATGDVGDESVADDRANLLKSPMLWLCIVGGIVLFVFCIKSAIGFFSKGENADSSSVPVSVSAPVPIKAVEPPMSTRWGLVGFVHQSRPNPNSRAPSEPIALVQDASGNTRYISFGSCRYFSDFAEAYCIVDGEKVTRWSLKSNGFFSGGLKGVGGIN